MNDAHRLRVSSIERISGTPDEFAFDCAPLATRADFRQGNWRAGVEWITPLRNTGADPRCSAIVLNSKSFSQHGSYDSQTRSAPDLIAILPRFGEEDVFAVTGDMPLLRRAHLGFRIVGDELRQSALLKFTLRQVVDGRLLPIPNAPEYTLSLVFWQIDPLDDDIRLVLSTADRSLGTTANAHIDVPVSLPHGDGWMLAAYVIGTLNLRGILPGNEPPAALQLVSDDVRNDAGERASLWLAPRFATHFQGTPDEHHAYGVYVSIKPIARDEIGNDLKQAVSGQMRLMLLDPDTGLEPDGVLDDFIVVVHVYRASHTRNSTARDGHS
mmetsp:Transcript_7005/g.16830  ORF Transcript_7005/g.16830 Transcript_7005/m.16830 type:complete len:326 (-) Transcript_7005:106-1083(-)